MAWVDDQEERRRFYEWFDRALFLWLTVTGPRGWAWLWRNWPKKARNPKGSPS